MIHRTIIALLFLFLLAPVLLVFPMSFSADRTMAWPPASYGLRWYIALAHQPDLAAAARNSLILGIIVTLLSMAIAGPAALAFARRRVPGRAALLGLLTAPLLLPTIVLALAVLIVFVSLGLIGSWPGLVLAHLLVALPYALRVLTTAFTTLPDFVEDAAASLGASPMAVLRHVTLPLMLPGLIATAAIVFLISFDEVVLSLFIVGPNLTTLPVALFRYVETRTDPQVAAVSALLVLFTLAIVIFLERVFGVARTIGRT